MFVVCKIGGGGTIGTCFVAGSNADLELKLAKSRRRWSILTTLANSILATLARSILATLPNSILATLARSTLPTALGRSQTCLLWPSTDAKWDLQELLLGPNLDWGALLSFSALLLLMLFRILRLPRCIFLLLLCGKDFSLNLFARSFANTLFVVMGKEIDYN